MLWIGLAMPSANADDVTYNYTGNNFNSFQGTPPAGISHITAFITLADPLPHNFGDGDLNPSDSDVLASVISWSISDQLTILDAASGATLNSANFATDDAGNIIAWYMQAHFDDGTHNWTASTLSFLHGSQFDYTDEVIDGANWAIFTAGVGGERGTWTVSPEPNGLILVGTVVLGIVGMMKWRLKRRLSA